MKKDLLRSVLVLLTLLLVPVGFGCQESPPAPEAAPSTAALTYFEDVAPIFQEKCVGCHQEGGIGPFRLDTYDSAKRNGLQAAAATRAGIMPPYLVTHDGSCGQFQDHETLSAAQKSTIWDWANGGMKEGTPSVLPARAQLSLGEAKEWKTPVIVPVAQGGELAQFDEYRCFPLDSNLDRDVFITGYEVLPGTAALVHHVGVFLVDPARMTESGKTNAEVMQALDDADPDRPGWSCYGAAGDGVDMESAPVVWAPGQGPVSYPAGVGVPQAAGHKLVVQMHYNLAHHGAHGLSDSTAIRLRQADAVERVALFTTADGFLASLFDPSAPKMSIPAGQRSTKISWKMGAEQMGLGDGRVPYLDVIGIMPHMHERGRSMQLKIGRADGDPSSCIADVPRWDFHWQKLYFYRDNLPRLDANSTLEATCEYDTSKDSAPIVPGWGTRNEMCAAIMMVTLPQGM
jgi:hypothetical protein